MSGQVADIISESIKRKITKLYGGSFPISVFPRWEPGLPDVIVWEALTGGGGSLETFTACLQQGRHGAKCFPCSPRFV